MVEAIVLTCPYGPTYGLRPSEQISTRIFDVPFQTKLLLKLIKSKTPAAVTVGLYEKELLTKLVGELSCEAEFTALVCPMYIL